MPLRYRERRRILEELELDGPCCSVPEAFEDGAALLEAVCERGLEGLVAKRLNEPYRPGERSWPKVKNRAYLPFAPRLNGQPCSGQ
jgi:bifunctional non-homologous end joining protein LigD